MAGPWLLHYYSGVSRYPYKYKKLYWLGWLVGYKNKELIIQVKRDTFLRTAFTVDYNGLSCCGKMSEVVLEKTAVVRNGS